MRRLLCLALFASLVSAQTSTSQITGSINDPQGMPIAGAEVTMTNKLTGIANTSASNAEGVYRVLALPPGEYRLLVKAAGFEQAIQDPLTLAVATVVTSNVQLKVGSVTDTVVVSATAALLESASASVGQVMTTRSIVSLPLNQRDPLALIALTPGVTLGAGFGVGGKVDVGRNFGKDDFFVGGSRSGTHELLIDGAPDTIADVNKAAVMPPVDSVQEFKVQTNIYSAEFGRSGGAVVNLVTKSGTNQVHAVGYEFLQNSALNANDFFNNRGGLKKLPFRRNQFGGNLGAPIVKNKLFIFGDYEGLRQGVPLTSVSTVPTALQRQGDFSQTLGANGQLIRVYDPATLAVLPDGSRTRTPYPGNRVPASAFDQTAVKTLGFMPLPNAAGDPVTGQNNFAFTAIPTTNTDKFDIRGDYYATAKTSLFVRFSHQDDQRLSVGNFAPPAGGGRILSDRFDQAVGSLTHTFSPQLIASAQYSFTRAFPIQVGSSDGFNPADLGFAANFVNVSAKQFPAIAITDSAGFSNNGADAIVQSQPRNTISYQGSLSYVTGRHSWKFGGEFRDIQFNEGQNAVPSGRFNFDRTFTQGPNPVQANANAGYGLAAFLLGAPTSGSQRLIVPISTYGLYWAGYAQDDWKLTKNLTLNLGLRYDVQTASRERYDRLASFNPAVTSPLAQASGVANLKGALDWVGNGLPRNQQATDYQNFGPRVGFAYTITPKTVIRGGYSIFYLPRNIQGLSMGAVEAFRDTPFVGSIDGVTPANKLSNPFPQGFLIPGNQRDPLANVGAQIQAPLYQGKQSYAQLFSLTVQREIAHDWVVSAYYWGNRGTRIYAGTWELNQLPNEYLALGSRLNDQVPNPFFGLISSGPVAGANISRRQSLLPYPQYTSVQQTQVLAGSSTFHGFTVSTERKTSKGLTFLGSYTASKAIDDINAPIDIYNRRLNRAVTSFDIPQRFIGSFVYNVPHHKFSGNALASATNFLMRDWDFTGILTMQKGTPVAIATPAVNLGRSAKLDNPNVNLWFDTTAFAPAAAFTFGNLGPRLPDVRSDGLANVDTGLNRNFPVHIGDRTFTTQFRAEFFNLFNSPQFGAPNGSVTSASFGRVTAQANAPRIIQFALKVSF